MILRWGRGLAFCFLVGLFFIFTLPVKADNSFKSAYEFDYSIKKVGQKIRSQVSTAITITNLKSDVYVKNFSLSFPSSFAIKDIKASDDFGPITPQVERGEKTIVIKMAFSHPNTGQNTKNKLYLQFSQDNLFKQIGNVWEVIIPTLQNRGPANYKVVVNLPVWTDKKISIAKPKPSSIKGRQIIWNNPREKTIYAVFGDKQFYRARLLYSLDNPQIIPVYTYIALPPETAYQKTYLNSLKPAPAEIKMDIDGNYLAKYFLKPKETKEIEYQGTIEVFSQPRPIMKQFDRENIDKEKPYLLTAIKYWQIEPTKKIDDLKTPRKIYDFVVNHLSYNYTKLKYNNKRLGAQTAFQQPDNAVCVEFSDLFIAIAREKGIYAREMEGYGYSTNSQFRPLSLASDTLHSWPEYYDKTKKIWRPVDPTWGNTSGIDYFSSLDLNHIVFAIHGKKSDYPYPAGMYKKTNFRSVYIQPTNQKPKERIKLTINRLNLPKKILTKKQYQIKIEVTNKSNVFLRNIPLRLTTVDLDGRLSRETIRTLAPLEKKTITLSFRAKKNRRYGRGKLALVINGKTVISEQELKIVPYYQEIVFIGGLIIAGALGFIFIVKRI